MNRPSRRTMIKSLSALTIPAVMSTFSRAQEAGAREKLRVAFIGVAGIGQHHLEEFSGLSAKLNFKEEPDLASKLAITCPCYADIDTKRTGIAKEIYPNAKAYVDYREMIEKEAKNFDAAVIGTPDHHHFPATLLCMKAGKHVYTQKPLTHTVWEARQLAEAARKYNVATQMGNQGHAGEGWRLVFEYVHSGLLGEIREAHSWSNRPIWPQGIGRPDSEDPVTDGLNWDLFLGPAPKRPFKKDVYHPFKWRGWWDFGCGALGDMGAHTMDGVFWALDAFDPAAVEPVAMTPMGPNLETFPTASVIKWEYPARLGRPAFSSYWYDGGLRPARPPELEANRNLPNTGNLFVGTKATLLVSGDYGNSVRIIPEAKQKEIGAPPKLLERSPGNYAEWVAAASGIKPLDYCKSSFTYAGPMTEVMLLGNVALRIGQRLEWDRENLKVKNAEAANRLINKEYREGWKIEV